jgi:RimJ/RimL family protein N-acetyltransferase
MLLGVRLAFPDPPLSAGGVVLRRPEPGDVAWITDACNDRELSRYIPAIPYPYTEADARAYAEHAARGWAEGSGATFVIAEVPGGLRLGMIELHLFAGDPGLAEVGYWLHRQARGRGVATTAVRLVAGWAFGPLGIGRLNLQTAPENRASQRVAERAGFTREGVLRAWMLTADGRRDSVLFSLLPDDQPTKTVLLCNCEEYYGLCSRPGLPRCPGRSSTA